MSEDDRHPLQPKQVSDNRDISQGVWAQCGLPFHATIQFEGRQNSSSQTQRDASQWEMLLSVLDAALEITGGIQWNAKMGVMRLTKKRQAIAVPSNRDQRPTNKHPQGFDLQENAAANEASWNRWTAWILLLAVGDNDHNRERHVIVMFPLDKKKVLALQ